MLQMADPGAVYECQDCGARTLRDDVCLTCGSEDLELVMEGP